MVRLKFFLITVTIILLCLTVISVFSKEMAGVILDGKSLTKQLLEKGYAREYYGKKKESWCK